MRDDDRSGLVAGFIDGALDARTHAEVEERIARDASWACEHTQQLAARGLLLDLARDTPPALPHAARVRLSAALCAHARASFKASKTKEKQTPE
jgi:hypothetical protein